MWKYQQIGVLGRPGSPSVKNSIARLANLLSDWGLAAALHADSADLQPAVALPLMSTHDLGQWSDLIIVVGGDGTMLGAARDFATFGVPLLGINRGRLGFLTDIMPEDMPQHVASVLQGQGLAEERFLLEASIVRQGQVTATGLALNDVVLHPGEAIRMIEFELWVDGQFVYSQRSDGLIVATPTGSTAYALSAGGPIMHPSINAMVLVPMFPHALTSRPLMISGDAELRIVIGADNQLMPRLSWDAQRQAGTEVGDEIHIRKFPHRLHLLHPQSHNYYDICRNKLGWSQRLGHHTPEQA